MTRSADGASAEGPLPTALAPARKPGWLKVKAPGGPNYVHLKAMMRELGLHTVCE
ncbi:MAG: lipoyl synthase, partial [Gemmatimonadales bacterium]|nr:lipoyl synthase [Gemmatimonadales bacterium]